MTFVAGFDGVHSFSVVAHRVNISSLSESEFHTSMAVESGGKFQLLASSKVLRSGKFVYLRNWLTLSENERERVTKSKSNTAWSLRRSGGA